LRRYFSKKTKIKKEKKKMNFLNDAKQLTYKTEHNGNKTEVPYLLYLPEGYENMGALPVILFLQCGNSDNTCGPTNNGCGNPDDAWPVWPADTVIFQKIIESGKFPCIIAAPKYNNWCDPEAVDSAWYIIDGIKKTYKCDPDRVYLMGIRCGAYGLYDYIGHEEDNNGIAAAVSIGGAYMFESVENISKVPLWICHDESDDNSKKMIEAVRQAGGKVQSTDYTNADNKHYLHCT
jgi:predicted peptidase